MASCSPKKYPPGPCVRTDPPPVREMWPQAPASSQQSQHNRCRAEPLPPAKRQHPGSPPGQLPPAPRGQQGRAGGGLRGRGAGGGVPAPLRPLPRPPGRRREERCGAERSGAGEWRRSLTPAGGPRLARRGAGRRGAERSAAAAAAWMPEAPPEPAARRYPGGPGKGGGGGGGGSRGGGLRERRGGSRQRWPWPPTLTI